MTDAVARVALVGANPGPAVHIAVLGIVVVAALVIFGVVRWRHKRDAVDAGMHTNTDDETLTAPRVADEHDMTPSGPDK